MIFESVCWPPLPPAPSSTTEGLVLVVDLFVVWMSPRTSNGNEVERSSSSTGKVLSPLCGWPLAPSGPSRYSSRSRVYRGARFVSRFSPVFCRLPSLSPSLVPAFSRFVCLADARYRSLKPAKLHIRTRRRYACMRTGHCTRATTGAPETYGAQFPFSFIFFFF